MTEQDVGILVIGIVMALLSWRLWERSRVPGDEQRRTEANAGFCGGAAGYGAALWRLPLV